MPHRADPRAVTASILALLAVAALGHMRLRRLASDGMASHRATVTHRTPATQRTRAPKPPETDRPAVGELREGERLDINRADAAALRLLPGIGPTLAERILRARRRHGPFPTLDALAGVRGIGPETLERLRPLAKAGARKPGKFQ